MRKDYKPRAAKIKEMVAYWRENPDLYAVQIADHHNVPRSTFISWIHHFLPEISYTDYVWVVSNIRSQDYRRSGLGGLNKAKFKEYGEDLVAYLESIEQNLSIPRLLRNEKQLRLELAECIKIINHMRGKV